MVGARIGWGLRGKPADSHDEYTVLASGGSVLGKGDFAGIFSRFSPGTPPVGREGPGALPWVVLGEFRDDHEHYLGLTVQDWSHDTDAAGRPISLSRFFYVPYTLVADHRISCWDLYAALRAVALPRDGSALDVELPETPEHERVARVERFGFARVASAAAMLLEGSVTITHAEDLSPEDRVAFFDAVTALLPCGWRTRFSAATWHNDGSRHLRLAFARRCRPGSVELDWRAPRLPEGAATAGDYWGQLNELTGMRGRPLADIVTYMASRTESLAGVDPSEAVINLGDLDRPRTVLQEARRGRADHGELYRLFASGRFRELHEAEDRAYLFDTLVRLGNTDDLRIIERLWEEAGGDPRSLVPAARAALRRRDPSGGEVSYLGLAERLGFADLFLAGLVQRPGPGEEPGGEAEAARLVLARAGEGYEQTFKAVADNMPVLCRLIHQLAADGEADLVGWFRRLARFVPADFLHPFLLVLHGQDPVDAGVLARLLVHGHEPLLALLRAAEARGRLDRVMTEFARLLIGDPRLGHEFWTTRLSELSPAGEKDQGVLDALLLCRDRPPRHLEEAARGDWDGYQKGFAAVLGLAGAEAERERILTRLAAHLREWAWYRDSRQVAAVLALASAHPDVPDLASAVLAARSAAPELIDDERYAAWRQRAFERDHSLVGEEPRIVLTALPPEAEPENVARLCAEMLGRGVLASTVVRHLDGSGWRLTGERTARLLDGTRRSLLAMRAGESRARNHSLVLARTILQTRSPHLVSDLRDRIAQNSATEMDYHHDLLCTIAADTRDEKLFHLGERARERLTDLAVQLKNLVDASRPRRRFGR